MTRALPPASMLMALQARVGSEWVTGVMTPMTPNGAYSVKEMPFSPLTASVRRNSTPGILSAMTLSFSILWISRPILVSSNSSRPSVSACSLQILRMQATALRRSSSPRASNCFCAIAAALTASATSAKMPKRWARPFDGLAWPLRIWLRTSWTTLRTSSSVTCMAGFLQTFSQSSQRLQRPQRNPSGLSARVFSPCSRGRENGLILHVDGIDDADNHGIDGQLLRFGCHAGARALDDEDHLALAGADRIDDHKCPAGGHQLVALARIDAERLDGQKPAAGHRGDLLRGDHTAGDFGEKHGCLTSAGQFCNPPARSRQVGNLPYANNACACRATINSSLVGMIQIWTRLFWL